MASTDYHTHHPSLITPSLLRSDAVAGDQHGPAFDLLLQESSLFARRYRQHAPAVALDARGELRISNDAREHVAQGSYHGRRRAGGSKQAEPALALEAHE